MNSSLKFYGFTKRYFSALPKVPKMEITLRTPYRTLFKNFAGWQRCYVNSIKKGRIAIGNKTPPVIYMLPPGEIKLTAMTRAEGNYSDANSNGEFMHSGGYAIVHEYIFY